MTESFNDNQGNKLSIPQVIQEVLGFMKGSPDKRYVINVGTDSELLASKNAEFVTAIVVRRVGNGGRYFWRQTNIGKFHTLRDRMIKEVLISLELAQDLLVALKDSIPEELRWDFEVHADVGEVGDTKVVVQEVIGMIRAHNFSPITKPYSYAASSVADRHV